MDYIKEDSIIITSKRAVRALDKYEEVSFTILESAWPDVYIIIVQDSHNYSDPHISCFTLDQIKKEYGEVLSNFVKNVL